jgi:hypothetical protein
MKRAATQAEERPAKRPRDNIYETQSMPALPFDGHLILCASPLDLVDGEARWAVAWDPRQCVPVARARIAGLLKGSARLSNLSAAGEAAWEYMTRGPRAVRTWDDLDDVFQRYTRRELGFTLMATAAPVRLWMVDEESDLYSTDSESSDPNDSDSGAEEDEPSCGRDDDESSVSFGPMDAWLGRPRVEES